MSTKQEAIELAKNFGWTEADAKRAFANLNYKEADEKALLIALAKFAGAELAQRQRLQAAQKAQVTKKTKYIKEIETEFATRVSEYEAVLQKERSLFVNIIAQLYKLVKPLGVKDPWIETLLAQYDEHHKSA
jgi:hypothetical protein